MNRGSHSGDYGEFYLLRYTVVLSGESQQTFGGTYIHFQPWRWGRNFPPKRWLSFAGLHDAISRTFRRNMSSPYSALNMKEIFSSETSADFHPTTQWRFAGKCRLHLQPWRQNWRFSPKRQLNFTGIHDIIAQKIELFLLNPLMYEESLNNSQRLHKIFTILIYNIIFQLYSCNWYYQLEG
jgi:hypothetical protein